MTNNFRKIEQLEKLGLAVTRTPSIVPVTAHNQAYLRVKEEKLGHDLGLSGQLPAMARTRYIQGQQ